MVTTEALRQTTIDRLPSTVLVGSPAGSCTGVDRIVGRITDQALAIARQEGRTVKALHEPAHNKRQSEEVREMGIEIVEDVKDIKPNDVIITSAHGVSPVVMDQLRALRTTVLDGTCPAVDKPHREIRRAVAEAREKGENAQIVYIGKQEHREAQGVIGEAPDNIVVIRTMKEIESLVLDPGQPQYVFSQTTLLAGETRKLMEALRSKFPDIRMPRVEDICFATQNRQDAVAAMIDEGASAMLVLGDGHSSNTTSLMKFAESLGASAHLFPDAENFSPAWIQGHDIIGITAGASAAIARIVELKERLMRLGVAQDAFRMVALGVREPNFTNPAPVHDFRKEVNE